MKILIRGGGGWGSNPILPKQKIFPAITFPPPNHENPNPWGGGGASKSNNMKCQNKQTKLIPS